MDKFGSESNGVERLREHSLSPLARGGRFQSFPVHARAQHRPVCPVPCHSPRVFNPPGNSVHHNNQVMLRCRQSHASGMPVAHAATGGPGGSGYARAIVRPTSTWLPPQLLSPQQHRSRPTAVGEPQSKRPCSMSPPASATPSPQGRSPSPGVSPTPLVGNNLRRPDANRAQGARSSSMGPGVAPVMGTEQRVTASMLNNSMLGFPV